MLLYATAWQRTTETIQRSLLLGERNSFHETKIFIAFAKTRPCSSLIWASGKDRYKMFQALLHASKQISFWWYIEVLSRRSNMMNDGTLKHRRPFDLLSIQAQLQSFGTDCLITHHLTASPSQEFWQISQICKDRLQGLWCVHAGSAKHRVHQIMLPKTSKGSLRTFCLVN